jgi:hypothetical protein
VCVCSSVTIGRRERWRENWTWESGRREKWREKDKTTIGWRAFEVLKPRSWEWNPVPVYRGPTTQVLRVKPSVRLSRSWNSGHESETECPFIEVLKPRSWEWNLVSVYRGSETQVLRAKYRGSETQCPESQMQQRELAGTGGLCPTVTGTH